MSPVFKRKKIVAASAPCPPADGITHQFPLLGRPSIYDRFLRDSESYYDLKVTQDALPKRVREELVAEAREFERVDPHRHYVIREVRARSAGDEQPREFFVHAKAEGYAGYAWSLDTFQVKVLEDGLDIVQKLHAPARFRHSCSSATTNIRRVDSDVVNARDAVEAARYDTQFNRTGDRCELFPPSDSQNTTLAGNVAGIEQCSLVKKVHTNKADGEKHQMHLEADVQFREPVRMASGHKDYEGDREFLMTLSGDFFYRDHHRATAILSIKPAQNDLTIEADEVVKWRRLSAGIKTDEVIP